MSHKTENDNDDDDHETAKRVDITVATAAREANAPLGVVCVSQNERCINKHNSTDFKLLCRFGFDSISVGSGTPLEFIQYIEIKV